MPTEYSPPVLFWGDILLNGDQCQSLHSDQGWGGGLKKHNTHMMGRETSSADSRVGSLDEVPLMRAECAKLVFG